MHMSSFKYSFLDWSDSTTGGGESAVDFVGVVDDPLEASESTDHEDSHAKTLPQACETNLGVNFLDLLSS